MRVMDIDPAHQPRKLRNLIGVQLQTSGLPDSINLDEAMKFFCAYHGVAPRYDLLDRFGLKEKRRTQYYQLSAGQQRRLGLALAVAHNPPVLFSGRAYCRAQRTDCRGFLQFADDGVVVAVDFSALDAFGRNDGAL